MKKIVAYGEILLRLSATADTIRASRTFDACYGGTESNVLACLHALGHETEYLSALPQSPLGQAALDHLERLGVGTSHVVTEGDGMGMYFTESGNASRGANVVYARKHSAFTRLGENSFDLDSVFTGADLFHVSGISFALSPSSRELAFRLVREARERHIPVSFDFNYRPALWSVAEAKPMLKRAAKEADILLASNRDLAAFMDTDEEHAMDDYPACKRLVLRDRTALSPTRHSVRIVMFTRGATRTEVPEFTFPVSEKIGGGDAFNGALLHSVLTGRSDADILRFAAAAFALKHTVPGDVLACGETEISDYSAILAAETPASKADIGGEL